MSSQECRVGTRAPKKKGRVVLPGDTVKDDAGAYAVFTEQGSSASQMTVAKLMDVVARLPDCAGQATDAVSANPQVKMEDAPRLLKIPNSKCPYLWIRLPRQKWPKSWSSVEDPVVSGRTEARATANAQTKASANARAGAEAEATAAQSDST